jgi:hypothetical protein
MNNLWQVGDRSRAICEHCGGVVETRFELRTYALTTPATEVPDVLVAVCITCNHTVAVPYQSSATLNKARRPAVAGAG